MRYEDFINNYEYLFTTDQALLNLQTAKTIQEDPERSMSELLDLTGGRQFQEIGLIDGGCGTGKTYMSLDFERGLINKVNEKIGLNIKQKDVLYLTPRSILRNQLNEYESTKIYKDLNCFLEDGSGEDKISVMNYHLMIDILEQTVGKEIFNDYKMIIIDEYHLLFADRSFIYKLSYLLDYINGRLGKRDCVFIGLTATPETIPFFEKHEIRNIYEEKYLEQYKNIRYRIINREIKNKYQAKKATVFSGASGNVKNLMNDLGFSADNKGVYCLSKAKDAFRYTNEIGEEAIGIGSEQNSAPITIEDEYGNSIVKKLGDFLNKDDREYLTRNHALPAGKNVMFMTSTMEVGVDIKKDETVKYIVIEDFRPHKIKQFLARFRQDFDNIYIVSPKSGGPIFKSTVREAVEFEKEVRESDEPHVLLAKRYSLQELEATDPSIKASHKHAPIVKKTDDGYEIDYAVFCYWIYEQDCYLASTNFYENETVLIFDKELPHRRKYYKDLLEEVADEVEFKRVDDVGQNAAKSKRRVESFDMKDGINKPLFKDEKAELARLIDIRGKCNRPLGGTSLKKKLEDAGYVIQEKRINGQRAHIIRVNN